MSKTILINTVCSAWLRETWLVEVADDFVADDETVAQLFYDSPDNMNCIAEEPFDEEDRDIIGWTADP